jgi:hypothetical protein
MKKYLLAIIALVLAAGLYSFTDSKNQRPSSQSTYYWYMVDTGLGDEEKYSNDDVTFLDGPLTIGDAPNGGCTASTIHKCVVGFSAGQLNTSTHVLNPDQIPPQTKSTRANP